MHAGVLADPIESRAQGQLQQQEKAIKPVVEGIAAHVASETIQVLQSRNGVEHPFAVGPPQASAGVVVIVGLIGKLVVVAVQTHPLHRPALAAEGAHHDQHPFEPFRGFKAAVGHQPVQAQGHPQHGHPIQDAKGHQALPAPEARQQRKDGAHMHRQHEQGRAHFQLALTGRQWRPAAVEPLVQIICNGCGCRRGCRGYDQKRLRKRRMPCRSCDA